MKGILLKDFYNLNGQLKMYAFFPLFGLLMAYLQHSAIIMIFMIGILIVTVPMSAFAYDDMADFSTYALTMPITRKDLVLSKYVLSFLITLVCGIVAMVAEVILLQLFGGAYFDDATLQDASLYTLVYMCVMNMVNCILLPLNFKFGTEKGRIFFFLIFFGIGGAGYALNYLSTLMEPAQLASLSAFLNQYGLYLFIFVVIAVEVISLWISTHILKHKEY